MLQNLSAVCLKNFIYLSQKQFLLFSFSSLSFTKNRLNSPFIILKKNELYQSQDIRFLRRRTSYGNIFRNTKASLLPVWAKKALRFLSKTTFSGLMLSGIHLWEVVRMKKMTALLLASVMTVSLAACGGNDDDVLLPAPARRLRRQRRMKPKPRTPSKSAYLSQPRAKTATAASRRFWASAMPMQSCQPWS